MKYPMDFSQGLQQQMEQKEMTQVFEWNKVRNPLNFIGSLLSKGVLCNGSNDSETLVGLKTMMVQLAIRIACSQGSADAMDGLTEALKESGNSALIPALRTWVKQDFAIDTDRDLKNKNLPVALRSLADQNLTEKPLVLRSSLFKQAASQSGLSKIATFGCPAECSKMGTLALEFDQEKMVASFADGTVKLWNWIHNEEKTIKFGETEEPRTITSIQYDHKILILGTAEGTVHLFDGKTQAEKWSIRLDDPVHSLRFLESTLILLTRGANGDKFWWVDISRADMLLRNQRPMTARTKTENSGILMHPIYSFLYNSNIITMQYTTSGEHVPDGCLEAPADISALNVLDLIPAKRLAVAGCRSGLIAIWTTVFITSQKPVKTLEGHEEEIVSLCALNGHLLSLDRGGKLLMWSGQDLENKNVTAVPRVLAENFYHVTSLVAHDRCFVSSSSEDGDINVWTVPDVWLRAG